MKSIKRREYIGFPRILSSSPRCFLEKWRGQWGVQQTTAKLANLPFMFAALSSAEFQGNGFSVAEHKRVSAEKKLLLCNNTFWDFLWQQQIFMGPWQLGSCAASNFEGIWRCCDLDMHGSFCLLSIWQVRICPTRCQEKCSTSNLGKNEPDQCEIVS